MPDPPDATFSLTPLARKPFIFVSATSRPTPGITRCPTSLKVDDRQRVGGRVHAVVRCRGRLTRPLLNDLSNRAQGLIDCLGVRKYFSHVRVE